MKYDSKLKQKFINEFSVGFWAGLYYKFYIDMLHLHNTSWMDCYDFIGSIDSLHKIYNTKIPAVEILKIYHTLGLVEYMSYSMEEQHRLFEHGMVRIIIPDYAKDDIGIFGVLL